MNNLAAFVSTLKQADRFDVADTKIFFETFLALSKAEVESHLAIKDYIVAPKSTSLADRGRSGATRRRPPILPK